MKLPLNAERRQKLLAVFRMPLIQTMVARKSTITNAFVNSLIPTIPPEPEEIEEALSILGLDPDDLRCCYCGDKATEWDHLRPLVLQRRPTGYISEIANLVPSCNKCNQSKQNKDWRIWMQNATAKLSPLTRQIIGIPEKMARLEAYEKWRTPTKIDFEATLGAGRWQTYWHMLDTIDNEMRRCQTFADELRAEINAKMRGQ